MPSESDNTPSTDELMEQIRREAYCLIRLCRELANQIKLAQTHLTYLRETRQFLQYISAALRAIESFLINTIHSEPEPEVVRAKLRDCAEIKKSVGWLYAIAKNAIDSDCLSIPFPLATYLNHVARGFVPRASLVVLTVPNLNFYKLNLRDLRLHAKSLATRVANYPQLPHSLGMLMFPYCAAKDVLVNCILFHEMGHYVYETTPLEEHLKKSFSQEWTQHFTQGRLYQELQTPEHTPLFWHSLKRHISDRMFLWANEIFADLYAIRLLGAAYHLAYVEMEQVLPLIGGGSRVFSSTHPADDFRFKLHACWLERDGWADEIQRRLPLVYKKLMFCKGLNLDGETFKVNTNTPFPSDRSDLKADLDSWMLTTFSSLVPLVESQVSDTLNGSEGPIEDFKAQDEAVTDLLAHGVVPSTVFHKGGKRSYPAPTTVLNSGFFFFLTKMDKLIDRVQSDDDHVEKRLKYEGRLNEWLSKAIEDWHILRKA